MYCPHCGTQLPNESHFCSECGKPIPAVEFYSPEPAADQQKTRRKPKVFLGILILAAVVTLAVLFIPRLGASTMGALFARMDWTYANVSQFDGVYTIRKAHTDASDQVNNVWRSILEEKVKETDRDLYDKIVGSPNIDLFLMGEGENETMYLAVTPDGDMYVNYGDDNTRYFTGAEDIYYALNRHLPLGDGTYIRNCIPEGRWSSLSIGFYDKNMNPYDSVYVSDPEEIGRTLGTLRNMMVKYGGGLYLDFSGYRVLVSLFEENGDYYFIEIYEEGSAEFPYGDWVYGVYDAEDVYNFLWDELCRIKGYVS